MRWLLAGALAAALAAPPTVIVLAAAVTADVAQCGPAGPPQTVEGTALGAEQLAAAQTITSVARSQGLPPRAAVIALATAMQESGLRNLPDLGKANDHDSLGLFQQRVRFYGADIAADPVRATQAFLEKLVTIPNWQTRPLTDIASDVQRPRADLRGAYARWEPLATLLQTRFWPTAEPADDCGNGTDDRQLAAGGTIPPGYQLPSNGQARIAVAFALQQIGEPYVFGADGPDQWDCSSLMQAAWAAAGVAIPRVTYEQVTTGIAVPGLAAVQPGDLLFIPGSLGSPSRPRHVGMYIGTGSDGHGYLVQAPRSGDTVKISPVRSWAGQIVAVRRPISQEVV